jgi:hypothetical protein
MPEHSCLGVLPVYGDGTEGKGGVVGREDVRQMDAAKAARGGSRSCKAVVKNLAHREEEEREREEGDRGGWVRA